MKDSCLETEKTQQNESFETFSSLESFHSCEQFPLTQDFNLSSMKLNEKTHIPKEEQTKLMEMGTTPNGLAVTCSPPLNICENDSRGDTSSKNRFDINVKKLVKRAIEDIGIQNESIHKVLNDNKLMKNDLEVTKENISPLNCNKDGCIDENSDESCMSVRDEKDKSKLSLIERRALNENRNKKFWMKLNEKFPSDLPSKRCFQSFENNKKSSKKTKKPKTCRRKMFLLPENHSYSPSKPPILGIQKYLYDLYPHRQEQIDMLVSLLNTFLWSSCDESLMIDVGVPPPIFISGASGTGKTSIVLDLLRCFFVEQNTKVSEVGKRFAYAYVNCHTLQSPCRTESEVRAAAIGLLYDIIYQLEKKLKSDDTYEIEDDISEIKRKRKKVFSLDSISENVGASIPIYARALSNVTNQTSIPCVLVLDNVEHLLFLTRDYSNTQYIFSQLLLLPKSSRTNLIIIVISSNELISYTGVGSSSGSLGDRIDPISIHFDSYKETKKFKDILETVSIKNEIGLPSSGKLNLIYSAMLDLLIPSLQDSTSNVQEMARLAGLLWPKYILPVRFHWEELTNGEKAIGDLMPDWKTQLDANSRPWIRKLVTTCIFRPGASLEDLMNGDDDYECNIPRVPKFLLLAAFLCQHNRSHADVELLSDHTKGQRTKKTCLEKAIECTMSAESVARRANKPFALERMLSVFSAIYSQYGCLLSED